MKAPAIFFVYEPAVVGAISSRAPDWHRCSSRTRDTTRTDRHRRHWGGHSHHALRRRRNHPRSTTSIVLASGADHRRIKKSPAYFAGASALSAILYARAGYFARIIARHNRFGSRGLLGRNLGACASCGTRPVNYDARSDPLSYLDARG